MDKQIFQFKISLNDVTPKVWRRIQVPETYTFWDLHCAIQDAMGWGDGHLHGFSVSEKKTGPYQPIRIQMPNPEWDDGNELDESKERVMDWFPERIKQCVYTYDFGDDWEHTVLFEKIMPAESGKEYPICLAGKNRCPPEDCGGPGGYYRLLKAIKNPKTEDDKNLLEWMDLEEGEEYDSTTFTIEEVGFGNPRMLLKEYLSDHELC